MRPALSTYAPHRARWNADAKYAGFSTFSGEVRRRDTRAARLRTRSPQYPTDGLGIGPVALVGTPAHESLIVVLPTHWVGPVEFGSRGE